MIVIIIIIIMIILILEIRSLCYRIKVIPAEDHQSKRTQMKNSTDLSRWVLGAEAKWNFERFQGQECFLPVVTLIIYKVEKGGGEE